MHVVCVYDFLRFAASLRASGASRKTGAEAAPERVPGATDGQTDGQRERPNGKRALVCWKRAGRPADGRADGRARAPKWGLTQSALVA